MVSKFVTTVESVLMKYGKTFTINEIVKYIMEHDDMKNIDYKYSEVLSLLDDFINCGKVLHIPCTETFYFWNVDV